jgi:uncharacterized protein YraI
MPPVTRLLTALSSLLLILAFTQAPALAATRSGTHAWSADTLVLRHGPSTAYHLTGEIPTGLAIKVLRCQKLWCLVDANHARGWAPKRNISFGRTPDRWPNNTTRYPAGGPGSACFYQGANFTGQSVCFGPGHTIKDLALLGLDNGFSSVRLEGRVSVDVCRDRFFQSYCERVIVSQPVLHQYLQHSLSSLRVY